MLSQELRNIAAQMNVTALKALDWTYPRHVVHAGETQNQISAKTSHGHYTVTSLASGTWNDLHYKPNGKTFEHLGSYRSQDLAIAAAEQHNSSKPAGRKTWDYQYNVK